MKHICPYCQCEFETTLGVLNAAKKGGYRVYCCREHSGLGRRDTRTKEQKVADKAEYDRQYRETNKQLLKTKKHEYFKKTYDPKTASEYRKARMHLHVDYCRRPEYRAKKVEYDRNHRAKKFYGVFWECAIIIEKINNTLVERADKAELRTIQGTNTKSLRRKRQWLRLLQNFRQLT